MPRVDLTDRFCKSGGAVEGKVVEYFDGVVKGLSLIVSAGGTRTFYSHFTRPTGRRARTRLGQYPDLSLAKAREKARAIRGDITEGIDPVAKAEAKQASATVSDLVDNYVHRHLSSKRSGVAVERRLRKNVTPLIGDVKLSDLHRRDLTRCVDAVMDRKKHTEANRVFEDVRALVRWARARGDLDQNVSEGMKRPAVLEARERALSAGEVKAFWEGLAGADMRESTRRVLRLCLVTGQRVGEVAGMESGELDLEAATWTIPPERAKNGKRHIVPLSELAISIIKDQVADVADLCRRKKRPVGRWVFPAPGGEGPVAGHAIAKALHRAIVTDEAGARTLFGLDPFTPHDLRRSAATGMEEAGVSPFIVAHVLNHISITKGTVTSRVYARYTYDKEKRDALDTWAKRVAGVLDGSDNITPFRKIGDAAS